MVLFRAALHVVTPRRFLNLDILQCVNMVQKSVITDFIAQLYKYRLIKTKTDMAQTHPILDKRSFVCSPFICSSVMLRVSTPGF